MNSTFKKSLVSLSVALGLILNSGPQAHAAIIFFNDQATFTAGQSTAGNALIGTETFEESTAAPTTVVAVNDPLQQGVPNGPFLTGLTQPITIQSNSLTGGATPTPGTGLAAATAGSLGGVTSDAIFAVSSSDSLDLIFNSAPQLGGVSFNPLNSNVLNNAAAGNTLQVQVFDLNQVLLGTTTVLANPQGTNFFGIQATGTDRLGRINLLNLGLQGESVGVDNISLYQAFVAPVPEPGTYAMFAIGLLALVAVQRRQRKNRVSETILTPIAS